MRFWFRLGRGVGVSMPWYIAIFIWMLWLCALAMVAALWLGFQLIRLTVLGISALAQGHAGKKRRAALEQPADGHQTPGRLVGRWEERKQLDAARNQQREPKQPDPGKQLDAAGKQRDKARKHSKPSTKQREARPEPASESGRGFSWDVARQQYVTQDGRTMAEVQRERKHR